MIPVFRPSIKRKDMDGVLTCLISDSIGFGDRAKEFIHIISHYLGTEAGFGLRDYSKGVGFVLDSLELEIGSKIIISPLSPDFYYDEITVRGFEVLYADIDPSNGCIDPEYVEELLSLEPSAILIHFPLGFIPELEALRSFGLPLILDISSAFSGNCKGVPFSEVGDIIIMNLEENGIITAGGGVLVFAADKTYTSKLNKLGKTFPVTSFLTDINASLGLIQFRQMEFFLEKRKNINEIFRVSLMKGRHKKLFQEEGSVPFSFPVLLEGNVHEVRQYARKKNIMTQTAFEDTAFVKHQIDIFPCPNAVSIVKRSVLFPLYPSLSKVNIEIISKVLSTLP